MRHSYWTEDAVKMLRALHDAGDKSATQIAAILSEHFGPTNKNAVIGKWTRLGLRLQKPKPVKRKIEDRAQKSSYVAKEPETVKAVFVPPRTGKPKMDMQSFFEPASVNIPCARVSLLELTEHTCRFPLGDVGDDDFAFCGNYAPTGKPYCSHHHALVWRPAQPMKKFIRYASGG